MSKQIAFLGLLILGSSLCVSSPCQAAEAQLSLYFLSPLKYDQPLETTETEAGIALIEIINKAKKTIDFAIYGLRNQPDVMNALKKARDRGVKVRGVVHKPPSGEFYYEDTPQLIDEFKPDIVTDYNRLQAQEAKRPYRPRCQRPSGFEGPLQCLKYKLSFDRALVAAHASRDKFSNERLMHNKFFIADGEWVWTGSANISDSCVGGYSANAVLLINSKKVARWYQEEFDRMFKEEKFGRAKKEKDKKSETRTITLDDGRAEFYFSPQDDVMQRSVIDLIKNAKQSIDIPVFFLTHKIVAGELIEAHNRGVKIRIIIDATAAKNEYTKHEILRAAGIPVKVESWGGKMHMKSAVVDEKIIILGSMNWTAAGERENDENTIVIYSESEGRKFSAFFQILWDSLPEKWLEGRPDPESKDSEGSCRDGIDNDFDKKIDLEDPGCGNNPTPLPDLPPFYIIEGYKPVSRVTDGDSIMVQLGRECEEEIRLIGVDAYEIRNNRKSRRDSKRTKLEEKKMIQKGKQAKEFLQRLIEGQKVRLEYDVSLTDRYGRILAYAYLEDGTFVNAEIIKAGYAQAMTVPPNVKHQELFVKLEKEAREN